MQLQPALHAVGQKRRQLVPVAWLMTDDRLGDAMLRIAARMPPRSAIIIRPHALAGTNVPRLLSQMRRIARARRHLLLWGGKGCPAGIDGVHLRHGERRPNARFFISRPVHNQREAWMARMRGADAVLISPVNNTQSHRDAAPLGQQGFARLAAMLSADSAAIGLGGMDARRLAALRRFGAHGWAAIDAWTMKQSRV